jgi:hypothetical protein
MEGITHIQTNKKYIVGCTGGGTLVWDHDEGGLITLKALSKRKSPDNCTAYLSQWTHCNVSLAELFAKQNIFVLFIRDIIEKRNGRKARRTHRTPYAIYIGASDGAKEYRDNVSKLRDGEF